MGVHRRTLGLLGGAVLGTVLVAGLVLHGNSGEAGQTELLTLFGITFGNFPQLLAGSRAPEFPVGHDVAWLNTAGSSRDALRGKPVSMKELRDAGKTVLIHFWDYTSMDCLRSLETVSHMHKMYSAYGLTVVSVHHSKEKFAHALPNVAEAVQRLGIKHAVLNDLDGDVASAYGSSHTLDMFLVDSTGMIRRVEGGNGSAEKMQTAACAVLASTFHRIQCGSPATNPAVPIRGRPTCPASTASFWVGRQGTGGLSTLQAYAPGDAAVKYADMAHVAMHDGVFALSGAWATNMDGITARADPKSGMVDTHLRMRYHAKAVYALMGVEGVEFPGKMCADGKHGAAVGGAACDASCYYLAGVDGLNGRCDVAAREGAEGGAKVWGGCTPCAPVAPVKVYVHLEGQPVPRFSRGADCQEDALGRTFVTVGAPRIYNIISEGASQAHSVKLIPAGPGVALHRFDFLSNCSPAPPVRT